MGPVTVLSPPCVKRKSLRTQEQRELCSTGVRVSVSVCACGGRTAVHTQDALLEGDTSLGTVASG